MRERERFQYRRFSGFHEKERPLTVGDRFHEREREVLVQEIQWVS
jgi:hypothetical protein